MEMWFFPQKWDGLRGYRDLWVKAHFPCPPIWWTDFAMGQENYGLMGIWFKRELAVCCFRDSGDPRDFYILQRILGLYLYHRA
jgi:hypothetical protein